MSFKSIEASESKKRYDIIYEKSDFWSFNDPVRYNIRLLNRYELSEDEARKIVETTINNQENWKTTKRGNKSYRIEKYNQLSILITEAEFKAKNKKNDKKNNGTPTDNEQENKTGNTDIVNADTNKRESNYKNN